jgi:Holliday junction resolvasome RuvABC endonuclease subunit
MAVIGISCDNNSLSYAILDGTVNSPNVLDCETYPLKQIEKGKLLDAAHHRIETLKNEHNISHAAILVVDTTFGTGQNTATHPIKHQIEGVILHKLFKDGVFFTEYNRKKLKKFHNLKDKIKIKDFIQNNYPEECNRGKVKNDNQREAFAVALTQL